MAGGTVRRPARDRDPEVAPLAIDDRTVFHMLQAVQFVEIGTGRTRERRRLTFSALDVEQIGYVYEGLLSYEGFRAGDDVVGLIGKAGVEAEVELGVSGGSGSAVHTRGCRRRGRIGGEAEHRVQGLGNRQRGCFGEEAHTACRG